MMPVCLQPAYVGKPPNIGLFGMNKHDPRVKNDAVLKSREVKMHSGLNKATIYRMLEG